MQSSLAGTSHCLWRCDPGEAILAAKQAARIAADALAGPRKADSAVDVDRGHKRVVAEAAAAAAESAVVAVVLADADADGVVSVDLE